MAKATAIVKEAAGADMLVQIRESGIMPQARRLVRVYQDGREFYDAAGGVLFTATLPVPDGDVPAARVARGEFEAWARRGCIAVVWEAGS